MFNNPLELDSKLENHAALIRSCISGALPFAAFLVQYDSFYWRAALDGHESDEEERKILASREGAISLHREVAEQILSRVCAEEDAQEPAYAAAGRLDPETAVQRLRQLAVNHGL